MKESNKSFHKEINNERKKKHYEDFFSKRQIKTHEDL